MKQILFFTLWLASLSALAQFPVNVLTTPGNQTITVKGTVIMAPLPTGVTSGTYGSATSIPRIDVGSDGRINGITNVTVSIPASITNNNQLTNGSGYLVPSDLTTLNNTAATNAANIAGLTSATATLNSTAITNAGNITTHTGQIAGLVSATTALDSRITTNTNSITLTNAALSNQFSMSALRAQSSALLALAYTSVYITDAGREGVFIYDATDNSTADDGAMVIVSNGRRYKRKLETNQAVSPPMFGAIAGDGLDDLAAFNACMAYALANKGVRVLIPGGDFNFSDTWKITGSTSAFQTITVEGTRATYFEQGTQLIFNLMALDRPGVVIGSARNVVLKNLTILGRNVAPLSLPLSAIYSRNAANYVTSGASDGRYNPYAALAIDAYAGTAPTGGYTNDSYGKAFSSRVVIEGCSFQQFVDGIAIAPAGQPQNDGHLISHCDFRSLKNGITIGTTQARDGLIVSCGFAGVHTIVDNRSRGEQNGEPPAMKSIDIINTFRICNLTLGTGGFSMEDSHAETFSSLGTFASNSTNARPVNFINCNFNRFAEGKGSDAALFIDGNEAVINFNGGSLWSDADTEESARSILNVNTQSGYVNLFGTAVFFSNSTVRLFGIREDASIIKGTTAHSRNSTADRQPWLSLDNEGYIGGRIEVGPSAKRYSYGGQQYTIRHTTFKGAYATSAAYAVTGWTYTANATTGGTKGGTVSFTSTQGNGGMLTGDYLLLPVYKPATATAGDHPVPVAVITAASGSSFTARMLFDEVVPTAPATVAVYAKPVLYGTQGIRVTTANATNQVVVTQVDGVAATTANVGSYVQVGDWLYSDAAFPSVNGTRVTGVSGTTLTMSRTANGTQTGHALASAYLVNENSYLSTTTTLASLTNDAGFITAAQSNTFAASQYISGSSSFGVGVNTLSDGSASYRNATLINNNENGAGWFTNNQSLPGYRGMVSITAYGANDARLGGSRPKSLLFLENWITLGFTNFQQKQVGNAPFVVNQQAASLNYLNQNLFWDATNVANASGQQVNSQSYFYVQGTSGGAAASLFDSKGYYSRGQFGTTNASITKHTDFHAAPFLDAGTAGNSITTRYGLLLDYDNAGTTNAWGIYQSGAGVKNYLLGPTTFGTSAGNGRDIAQFNGSIQYKPASGSANPTTSDITSGNCVLWTNTANSTTKLFCNISGTIVSTPALSSANN